jgi:hypothetical protein
MHKGCWIAVPSHVLGKETPLDRPTSGNQTVAEDVDEHGVLGNATSGGAGECKASHHALEAPTAIGFRGTAQIVTPTAASSACGERCRNAPGTLDGETRSVGSESLARFQT